MAGGDIALPDGIVRQVAQVAIAGVVALELVLVEALLLDAARTTMKPVEVPRRDAAERTHEVRKVAAQSQLDHQVHVVGHHHIAAAVATAVEV